MELAASPARTAPSPTWTGVTLATVRLDEGIISRPHAIFSTGAAGRTEGYATTADALRAARNLSRGAERSALAVVDYEGRSYVQQLLVEEGNARPLHFEAAFPARVGRGTLYANTNAYARLAGLVAIVDGSRSLRIAH